MTIDLAGATVKISELALDGLTLRHDAIASNIANVNTPGYRPVNVSFESQLASLLQTAESIPPSALSLSPTITYAAPALGQSAESRLDMNTVMLNQNVVQYEATIKALDKYMASIALAVNDGRR